MERTIDETSPRKTGTISPVGPAESARRLTASEHRQIRRLLDRAAEFDNSAPLSDHLALDFSRADPTGGPTEFLAVKIPASPVDGEHDAEPELIGYGQVSNGNDADAVELVIDPDSRAHELEITETLLAAVLDAVSDPAGQSDSGRPINWWVHRPSTHMRELAERSGLTVGRRLLQMRRSLPTEVHSDVETRSYRPGLDDDAWLDVNNRAFADHDEQGGWTIDTLRLRRSEPWFDPDGFRLLDVDGRLAGFCWTKVHPPTADEPSVGEIYVIAVDPDFHGRGLGKQLTLAGLDHLGARGLQSALLYVDADNESAVAMYHKLGFEVAAESIAFTTTPPIQPAD